MNKVKRWLVEREVRNELADAEKGKDGPEVQNTIQWLKTHKVLLSKITAGLVAGTAAAGYMKVSAALFSVATFLAGAGYLESDAFHKGT